MQIIILDYSPLNRDQTQTSADSSIGVNSTSIIDHQFKTPLVYIYFQRFHNFWHHF